MEEKEKKKKKTLIIIIICLLLLILMLTTLGLVYLKKQSEINGSGLSGYIIGEGTEPGLTEEEILELMQKKMDASKVTFSIYSEPVFDGRKGTIMFANPHNSAHDIDLVVKVDGKVIIRTAKISPNQYIEEIELIGKALKKGNHRGDALITAYNRETGEEVGKVIVELDITSK